MNDHSEFTAHERAVVEAAKRFAVAKDAHTAAWIEHGSVTPTLANSLDKATDNLLTSVRALDDGAAGVG